jgi:hypothetical protein
MELHIGGDGLALGQVQLPSVFFWLLSASVLENTKGSTPGNTMVDGGHDIARQWMGPHCWAVTAISGKARIAMPLWQIEHNCSFADFAAMTLGRHQWTELQSTVAPWSYV